MQKINFIHIIVNHLRTLRNFRTNRISITDIILFFITPIFLSFTFVLIWEVSLDEIIGDILKSIAIFSAFLLNMLAIVSNSLDKDKIKNDKYKKIYAKEIHSNLSFEILLGIFSVIFLIAQLLLIDYQNPSNNLYILKKIIEIINFSLLGIFLLTLIMCLNRIYILLRY